MTGDIREKLLASDAALSLEMETKVARAFRLAGWDTNQGVYYSDPISNKMREIDIYAHKTIGVTEGLGSPYVNFDFFCECKSLKQQHLLFIPDAADPYVRVIDNDWIGLGDHMTTIVAKLMSSLHLNDAATATKLMDYLEKRSYPSPGDRSLNYQINVAPPKVDIFAHAFRETDSAKTREEDTSVIWRSMLTLSSALSQRKKRDAENSLNWVFGPYEDLHMERSAGDIAYFIDLELLRTRCYHLVIFVKSNLWSLVNRKLKKIFAARLYISNIDSSTFCIDIVHEDYAEKYIAQSTKNLNQTIPKSLARIDKYLKKIRWAPRSDAKTLYEILKKSSVIEK